MLEGDCRVSAGGEWLALEVRTQRRGGQTPVSVRAVVQGGRRGAGAGGGQGGVSVRGPAPRPVWGRAPAFAFSDIPSLLHKCVSVVEKPRKGIGSYQSVAGVLGEGSDGCNFE